jgi:hypothetical protein
VPSKLPAMLIASKVVNLRNRLRLPRLRVPAPLAQLAEQLTLKGLGPLPSQSSFFPPSSLRSERPDRGLPSPTVPVSPVRLRLLSESLSWQERRRPAYRMGRGSHSRRNLGVFRRSLDPRQRVGTGRCRDPGQIGRPSRQELAIRVSYCDS